MSYVFAPLEKFKHMYDSSNESDVTSTQDSNTMKPMHLECKQPIEMCFKVCV